MRAAARHLTPVTLELGGKNPCVVDRSADLTHAARRIAWGKFINGGQSCVAPDYVLAQGAIAEQLIGELTRQVEEFYGPDPQRSPDFARMVDRRQLDRLRRLLEGGEIVVGGVIDEEELYLAPTILRGVSLEHPLMQEEIFGPLLPVVPFEDLGHALAIIGDRPRSLALYVFADDQQVQERLLDATTTGGACVNDVLSQMTTTALPFGGVGPSGMGSYHGIHGFETFSHHRAVMRKGRRLDGAFFRYPPYAGRQRWIERLKKLYR
jgi:acyl-CoA reductase-like NAD-dependent aldehyde dehydrogenase